MNSDLPSTTRHVLHVLSFHMDEDGTRCFPSTRLLERETGLSRRSVEARLREAIQAGWIRRHERPRDAKVRWQSFRYTPMLPPTLEKDVPQDLGEHASPSQLDLGETSDATLGKLLPLSTPVSTPSNTYPPEFERFWSAFPKRDGANPKKKAFRHWKATLKRNGADADTLIAAAERYAEHCRVKGKVGTEFVLYAATFLGPDKHWQEEWVAPREERRLLQ